MDFVGDAEMIVSVRVLVSGGVSTKASCERGSLLPPPPQATCQKASAKQQDIFVSGCIVSTPSNLPLSSAA